MATPTAPRATKLKSTARAASAACCPTGTAVAATLPWTTSGRAWFRFEFPQVFRRTAPSWLPRLLRRRGDGHDGRQHRARDQLLDHVREISLPGSCRLRGG